MGLSEKIRKIDLNFGDRMGIVSIHNNLKDAIFCLKTKWR
jgi:hypothetical protein